MFLCVGDLKVDVSWVVVENFGDKILFLFPVMGPFIPNPTLVYVKIMWKFFQVSKVSNFKSRKKESLGKIIFPTSSMAKLLLKIRHADIQYFSHYSILTFLD